MINEIKKTLHNSSKYPTSLIVRGSDSLGLELAKSLLEQGGFVILIDSEENGKSEKLDELRTYKLLTILDFSAITILEEDLRRLDYVFYLQHKSTDLVEKISTQEFLQFSNYLDTILDLTAKFEAKFLLTTSLKAHQLILASKQIDMNFDAGVDEGHTIYSELEIQRYAESLVSEYQKKVGIDARTIRLGELLGKGIDINYHSNLTKVIIQALKGEEIKLPGDGLEADYYVHYLDAAYGILKAQFSLNTKANTYTLANEEEITLLSIAYKLLDLVPTAIDVGFIAEDEDLPPMRLYKPAPNLGSVGWKPRVSFERALNQTIEHIRNTLLKKSLDARQEKKVNVEESVVKEKNALQNSKPKEKKKLKTIVKDFFFTTEEIEEKEMTQDEHIEGALARLVSERKNQETSRRGSIIMANNKLRDKSNGKNTISRKSSNFFTLFYSVLRNRFNFLKNITLTDFIFSTLGVVAFLIIYFLILSPFLSLGKNVLAIKLNLDAIEKSLNSSNITDSSDFALKIKDNSIQAQERLNETQFLFEVFGQKPLYENSQEFLTNFIEYVSGYQEILASLEPLDEYFKHLDPGVKFTYSNSNLLTISNDQDFKDLIEDMKYNTNLISIGDKRIQKTSYLLGANLDKLPDWFSKNFKTKLSSLDNTYTENSSLTTAYEFIPDLLGEQYTRKYLFVIQDNSRFTSAGGEICGYVLVEVRNGALINIDVYKKEQLESKISDISDVTLQKINLLSNDEINRTNVKIDSLNYLEDSNEFFTALNTYFYQKTNNNIDMIVSLNLVSLEQFLAETGSVEFQQIKLSDDNLLSNINLLIGNKRSNETRNEIILQISSLLLEKQFNSLKDNYPAQLKLFSKLKQNGNIQIYAPGEEFNGLISKPQKLNLFEDYVSFGTNYDNKNVIIEKYPNANIELKVTVDKSLQTKKDFKLNVVGTDSFENAYICLPLGSKNISYYDVQNEFASLTFSEEKTCNIFIPDDNSEYGIKYETVSFDNDLENGYNYSLLVEKMPGIDSNYYIEIDFDPALEVEPVGNNYSRQNNKFIYSGYFDQYDLNLTFKIK